MDFTYVIYFFVVFSSLFTIINPISTAPVFLTITKGDSEKKKRKMAKKSSIVSAIVLIVFSLLGTYILSFFSITLEAFRIAGGLLVARVGFLMLTEEPKPIASEKAKSEAIQKEDISIIPLAIPLLSGPGAMTTSIVLMTNTTNLIEKVILLFAIVVVCILTYIILSHASLIEKVVGENGKKVIEKILGLIVVVVGVQFVLNGFDGFIGIIVEKYFG